VACLTGVNSDQRQSVLCLYPQVLIPPEVAGQNLRLCPSVYESYFGRLTCYAQLSGVSQIMAVTCDDIPVMVSGQE
jgi:hypothetical protein